MSLKRTPHSDMKERTVLSGSIMQDQAGISAHADLRGAIAKGKLYDGVTTIKEMGRSIHEIPRQELLNQESQKNPEMVPNVRPIIEGSISQGTPIKYESSSCQSAIKHNVKSLITGPSKLSRGMPPMEMLPENMKVVERGKHEDPKAGEMRSRHTSVVSSGPSVLRSTLHEAPKSQVSPGIYEDANARRTPVGYQSNLSSGKPLNHERKSTLTPTQRESVPAKSPVPGVDPGVTHSPSPPPPRGSPRATAYMFQRQLSPTPGYPSQYQLYAMENTRQTILNDYITSQQMQVNLRPDLARGLNHRPEQHGSHHFGAPPRRAKHAPDGEDHLHSWHTAGIPCQALQPALHVSRAPVSLTGLRSCQRGEGEGERTRTRTRAGKNLIHSHGDLPSSR
ncbi:hypothetical protein E2320_007280 [Naja naja]|nr:hypothetical protein E2320_007280 [Naja naja]